MSETAASAANVPVAFVSQTYIVHDKFEDVILGQFLRPGMIVLLRSSRQRGNPDRYASGTSHIRTSLLQKARWCQIESLTPAKYGKYDITFTGLYADGGHSTRTTSPFDEWIVKKSSRP